MKRIQTYQQGDPEWLIIHKQYHELHAEERDALAEWIQSQEDYDRMRQVLMELHDEPSEWEEPDASIKQNLMRKFATEEKGGKLIWLNSVFLTAGAPWYKQPALRMGLAAACIIGLVVFFLPTSLPSTHETMTAEQNEQSVEQQMDPKEALAAADSSTKILQQFAEVKSELPLAPSVVETEYDNSLTEDVMAESTLSDGDGLAYDEPVMAPALVESKDMAMAPQAESEAAVSSGYMEKRSATSTALPQKLTAKDNSTDYSVSMSEVDDLLDDLYTAR
jgi:hypothetical protein